MKKILISLSIIGVVAAIVIGATTAFFSDTETSTGNVFTAGSLDLKIDNHCFYNGLECIGGYWGGEEEDGNECTCTWELDELDGHLFFDFDDLKPGDWGEDTISIHIDDNPAWLCADIEITENDDVSSTEPELEDGDAEEDPVDFFDGELAQNLEFVFWVDDGDNVLEASEEGSVIEKVLVGAVVNGEVTVALADSLGGLFGDQPMPGGTDVFIGKAWCFGEMILAPVVDGDNSPTIDPGIICNGAPVDNTSQTDSLMGDVIFRAVQSRHNSGFVCGSNGIGCLGKADVMLVLDRSGSIDTGELDTLKTAAHAFVTALSPTSDGVHMGQTSFSTTGTMDLHLTDDVTAINGAITGLVRGGNTNLYEGIDLANTELGGGDGHDRPDGESLDFMVVITDGNPNEPDTGDPEALAIAAADAAKAAGVTIYVVGVGTTTSTSEWLRDNIATSAVHYYDAGDFSGLESILQSIASCE